jgi:hypothetical protein
MKPQKKNWPEVLVSADFLQKRGDIITNVIRPKYNLFSVSMDHPVLGEVVEVYQLIPQHRLLCLKSIYPKDMQDEAELEAAKDYYNRYLLDNADTYIEYFNKEVGYFLLSKNVTQV